MTLFEAARIILGGFLSFGLAALVCNWPIRGDVYDEGTVTA
jgi:hypothetical protein